MEFRNLSLLQSSGRVQALHFTVTAEWAYSNGLTTMCVWTE